MFGREKLQGLESKITELKGKLEAVGATVELK